MEMSVIKSCYGSQKIKNILIIYFLLFISCNNQNSKSTNSQVSSFPKGVEKIKDTVAFINNSIINYYENIAKYCYDGATLKIDSALSDNRKTFELDIVEDSEISTKIEPSFEHHSFPIRNFIYGDLNGDKNNDIVVEVDADLHGGSMSHYKDIFLFITNDNKLCLHKKVYKSYDLGKCSYDGAPSNFIPTSIENMMLIGKTYCYKEYDPLCCPSLKFRTTYYFRDNLIFKEQLEVTFD
jgi:hypothetical protein